MSYVGKEVFQTEIDCSCGAAVTIADLREHMVRRHCNVDGCSERALRTVTFGFRDPQFKDDRRTDGHLPAPRALDRQGADAPDRRPAARLGPR